MSSLWLDKIHSIHKDWADVKSVDSEHEDFSKADYAEIDSENPIGKIGLKIESDNEGQTSPAARKKNNKTDLIKVARLSGLQTRPELLFSTENI
ncbi:MAG: hypothetical protein V1728_04040, partial [Candidatus Micrarchaeota archaeon]